MIDIIKAKDRHFTDFEWLQTYWLFSFSSYYDPHNLQFGSLRVFNDDVVNPGTGFPTHPHEEMEIITIVLSGEMTHEDSMGNKSVIKAGDVQRMSAGTGLTHSEFNLAETPVNFYQIWIVPDESALKPTYDQKTYALSQWKNQLFPVASGQGISEIVTFHADATIYRCDLEEGQSVVFDSTIGRRVFIYLTKGEIAVNGEQMEQKDQARIDVENPLSIIASNNAEVLLIDVPCCGG